LTRSSSAIKIFRGNCSAIRLLEVPEAGVFLAIAIGSISGKAIVKQKIAFLYLKKFGYLADIANNGAEALNMISSQNYDLLFMDMQMPVMDGITATKAIRQNAMLQSQPKIVAMTANVMPEDVQSCLDVGMNDYISKPIRTDEIVRILTQFQNKD